METELTMKRDVLKKVVKRKKAILCKTLTINVDLLEDLASKGVINPSMVATIKSLKENNHMACVVENLILDSPEKREAFLEFVNEQSTWMHEEIIAEAKAETNNLKLDDYEVEDASFLIHRHFGSSKRFCELDKKTMTSLIATKAQVAKELWSRRLSASTSELEETKKIMDERNDLIKNTNESIKTFLKRNERELHDFRRAKSTTQILSSKKKDAEQELDDLISKTDFLVRRFERVLLERQAISEQREQCMAILKVNDNTIPLHKLIKQALDKLSSENENGKAQIKSLQTKTIHLEDEINERDAQVEKLLNEIEAIKQALTPKQRTLKSQASISKTPTKVAARKEEIIPIVPKATATKPNRLFPLLEQQANKPKYCTKPIDNNVRSMPLHGRSYILDVA